MKRVLRVRFPPAPANDWPGFSKGHGVVGCAWQHNDTIGIDFRRPELLSVTATTLADLPEDLRMGLSWPEFQRTRQDMRAVWASPIQREYQVAACLSLNLDANITGRFERLDKIVRPALRDMSERCRIVLSYD